MENKFLCPVCGQHEFDSDNTDEQCPICHWWNDVVQNRIPDYSGGGNKLSLNEFREKWKEKQNRP